MQFTPNIPQSPPTSLENSSSPSQISPEQLSSETDSSGNEELVDITAMLDGLKELPPEVLNEVWNQQTV